MAGSGVLSVRFQRAFTIRARRGFDRREVGQRPDIAQAELLQVRKMDFPGFEYISKRVGPGITPFGGIRHLADTRAVEHHQHYAIKLHTYFALKTLTIF
jgi:hypothetical protein